MPKILKIGPTNCYLLRSMDGYLLIDTSLPKYLRPFLKKLKKAKVDLTEIGSNPAALSPQGMTLHTPFTAKEASPFGWILRKKLSKGR